MFVCTVNSPRQWQHSFSADVSMHKNGHVAINTSSLPRSNTHDAFEGHSTVRLDDVLGSGLQLPADVLRRRQVH